VEGKGHEANSAPVTARAQAAPGEDDFTG
jgi:hypothetical protein